MNRDPFPQKRVTYGNALNAAARLIAPRVHTPNSVMSAEQVAAATIWLATRLGDWLWSIEEEAIARVAPADPSALYVDDGPTDPVKVFDPADPRGCPQCGGEIWDNRADKRNGKFSRKGPDFKCQDSDCDWAFWIKRKARAS